MLVVALLPVSFSYGKAMAAPGQAPLSVRSVDWLRGVGGAPGEWAPGGVGGLCPSRHGPHQPGEGRGVDGSAPVGLQDVRRGPAAGRLLDAFFAHSGIVALDINTTWVNYFTFDPSPGHPASPGNGSKLLSAMVRPTRRYFSRTARDFIAAFAR